jgi:hypothetical protein
MAEHSTALAPSWPCQAATVIARAAKGTAGNSGASGARGASGEETGPRAARCELNPRRPSLPGSRATAVSGPSVDQVVNVQLECSVLASAAESGLRVPRDRVRFRLAAIHGLCCRREVKPSAGGAQTMLALCCVQFLQGRGCLRGNLLFLLRIRRRRRQGQFPVRFAGRALKQVPSAGAGPGFPGSSGRHNGSGVSTGSHAGACAGSLPGCRRRLSARSLTYSGPGSRP